VNNYFYLEAMDTSTIPFTIAADSACELYHKDAPTVKVPCTVALEDVGGKKKGVSIKTSKQLAPGTIHITLQAINLYVSPGSVPAPTPFNIRTCTTAKCDGPGALIDNYQFTTISGGNKANVEMGFTGVLTTKLKIN